MKRGLWGLVCAAAAALSGCAQMKVTKIDPHKRAEDRDNHVKGFRYYLSRPYVLVKDKLTIATETSLVVVPAATLESEGLAAFLASAGAESVDVIRAADGSLDRISAAEWDRLRSLLVQSAPGVVIGQGRAARDAAGRPVARAADAPLSVTVPPGADSTDLAAASLDDTAGAGGGGAGSPGGGKLPPQQPPTDDGFKTVNLKGAIDIVFLPDFDEQYAVHNENVFSKSSYGMTFRDGWQLVGVNGDFDSTPVAIALLETIDSPIDTGKSVATTGLETAAKLAAARRRALDLSALDTRDKTGKQRYLVLEVRREKVIQPGLYRINKPWEAGPETEPCGAGLLAKLGLPVVEVVSVVQAEVVDKP